MQPGTTRRWRRSSASHAASRRPAASGRFSGEIDGHRVFVDPDERARIVVYTRIQPQAVLRTFEHEKRVPAGMIAVMLDGVPPGFWKDAYAAPAIAPALEARSGELGALVRPFAERWPRTVSHLSVTPERLECALDFGRPIHIPPEVVETLLPAAIALVRFFESLSSQ